MKLVLCISAIFLLCGCTISGKNFDESKVADIQVYQTTELEVVQMFGNPTSRSVGSDGLKTLTWSHAQQGFSNIKTKALVIYLRDGVVVSFGSSESIH